MNSYEPRLHETAAAVIDLATWRKRRSWAAAAAQVNRHGMAAAVPPELVTYCRRLGLTVWPAGRGAA